MPILQGSSQQPQSSYTSGPQSGPPSKFADALEPLTGPSTGTAAPQSGSTGGIGAAVVEKASQLYSSLPTGVLGSSTRQSHQGDVSQQPTQADESGASYSGQVSWIKQVYDKLPSLYIFGVPNGKLIGACAVAGAVK